MRQIPSIQILRAAAAIAVVVGHAQTEAAVAAGAAGAPFAPLTLLPWGAGVDLFFVISGFIMVVSSGELFARPDGRAIFVRRRLARILPLWWIFAALYLAIQVAAHRSTGKPLPPAGDILAGFALWPTDLFHDGVPRPFFTLGWTLEYEMSFYALFALALGLSRVRAVVAVVGALLLLVMAGAVAEPQWAPLLLVTRPIVLEFAFGAGLGLVYSRGVRLSGAWGIALVGLGLVALAADGLGAAGRLTDWITPNDVQRTMAWGMPAALLVAGAALAPARSSRWSLGLVLLGDASYALYLSHPFIVGIGRRLWTAAGLDGRLGWGAMVVALVPLACLVALAVHLALERPLLRRLKRRAPARAATIQPAPAA